MVVSQRQSGDPDLAVGIPLFEQAQAGCRTSLNQLMHRHDGLVQAVVRKQYLGDLPFAEALQAGRVGLWRAILGYDAQRGYAFSTYAWPAIMRQVWRAVKVASRDLLLPIEVESSPSSHPDPALLNEAADVQAAVQTALHQLLERLPQHLRQIVCAYYGLNGQRPASYRQLGAQLGLSHERVRQLLVEALVWLRHPAHSQALRTLLDRHTLEDYRWAEALAQRWLRQRGGRHVHL